MEQQAKRIRFTKESAVTDIASSIDDIANSVKSVSVTYSDILRINTAVVTYLRNAEQREKPINQSTEDIERSLVREKR
ncbi:Uncharacterized protein DBV15_09319 [Temnothorax longispinosus]|uniref:Uncharacterized protein n=1 Tax=Temnothorax longispinosus TaxID=300112 RepID=A0A4S2KFV0_9HYME|nr:Uncharacterized protein DBV15_09319 [Temnothorax longispinosus]